MLKFAWRRLASSKSCHAWQEPADVCRAVPALSLWGVGVPQTIAVRVLDGLALGSLDLSRAQLTQLPAGALAALASQLRLLNLQSNRLSVVPDDVSTLLELETLRLGDNSLTELPGTTYCCLLLTTY